LLLALFSTGEFGFDLLGVQFGVGGLVFVAIDFSNSRISTIIIDDSLFMTLSTLDQKPSLVLFCCRRSWPFVYINGGFTKKEGGG
jgi:hypothetical protein